jgi:hypothetical protein
MRRGPSWASPEVRHQGGYDHNPTRHFSSEVERLPTNPRRGRGLVAPQRLRHTNPHTHTNTHSRTKPCRCQPNTASGDAPLTVRNASPYWTQARDQVSTNQFRCNPHGRQRRRSCVPSGWLRSWSRTQPPPHTNDEGATCHCPAPSSHAVKQGFLRPQPAGWDPAQASTTPVQPGRAHKSGLKRMRPVALPGTTQVL